MKPTESLRIQSDKAVAKHKIPLAVKVVYTLFVIVLVPIYLHEYGATNFLWFCDVALLLTLAGLWLESSLLVSMCAVGIIVPQILWLADFGLNFMGIHLLKLTGYMFDSGIPLFIRGLSLFHGWLPLLLVWLLHRVGYDKRAFLLWSILAVGLVLACYFFTPPAGAKLANPNTPLNINNVYGFNDKQPQQWMNQNLYVGLWMGALIFVVYLPTHLVLRKVVRPSVTVT